MSNYSYGIRSRWWGHPGRPASLAKVFLETLDSLRVLDPLLREWRVLDYLDLEAEPLPKARPNMTMLAERGVATDDYDKPDPDNGYTLTAFAGSPDLDSRHVDLTIRAGGRWENRINFGIGALGGPSDTELVTYARYRRTLEVIARHWPCPWACAYAFESNYPRTLKNGDIAFPSSRFHIAWIAYLSAPFVKDLKPPAELTSESTPGGGLILSAALERLDPDNLDHLHRARLLAELMLDRVGEGGPGPDWGPRTGPY